MWLYTILLLVFAVEMQCESNATDCLAKKKSRGVLDFAKESINKAKNLLPNCSDSSTNATECGAKEEAIAFLEIATDLIKEAENNYPTCPEPKPVIIHSEKPMDCTEVLQIGNNTSGVYTVWPRSRLLNEVSIQVYCDMETDGGGWTVIQRRGGFSKSLNFNQDWENYKKGFGDLEEEFWLGNDNIFGISNQGKYEVRFDLEDFEGNKRYAVYKVFWIEDEEAKYKIHAKNYSGNAGDSMSYDDGSVFCTKDKPHGKQWEKTLCTVSRETGWWFNECNKANINGVPRKDSADSDTRNLYWKEWKAYKSLAKADMKLRRI